ncbi:MAG: hypothetical protein AB8B96_03465 [Lysobacterales bacterium]
MALPTLSGGLLLMGLMRRSLTGPCLMWCLAGGHLLGLGLTSLIMAVGRWAGLSEHLMVLTALVLLAISVTVGLWVSRTRERRERSAFSQAQPTLAPINPAGWIRPALCGFLVLWAGLILLLVGSEILLRPLYPWDAWSAWSVKARVWAELGADVDFVSFTQWLGSADTAVFTNEAWNYPETLPLMQLWMTGWLKVWDPVAANVPWFSCGVALTVLIFQTCRLFGLSALAAAIVMFLLTSAPILTTQIALAGYADLWLCAALVLFVACLTGWLDGWLSPVAACLALALIASLKLEGLIWMFVGAAAVAASHLPPRLRLRMLITAAGTFSLWWVVGGFSFSAAGFNFVVTPQMVEIPYLGRHPLAFSNQLGSVVTALVELPNWHLLWVFGLPAMGLATWRSRGTAQGRGLAGFVLTGLGFLFVLFFFTQAAAWAESMTASNRLALHMVPAAGLWAALILATQRSVR